METVWFAIVSGMLATYAVLDGFDFGVGILQRLVARTDDERRTVLAAIGPVWDGNEVWLIAAGGVLFMAFPRVYATAFSGFYMALMIVLWLLILRGVAIEYRSHQENPLWREFWDSVFSIASALLAVTFGATIGNLVRGVPVAEDGLRAMPLFTDFRTGPRPGILDWYTILTGLLTLTALAGHGALYLAWRTRGAIRDRSLALAGPIWTATLVLWAVATAATAWVRPGVLSGFASRPWNLAFVVPSIVGAWGVFSHPKKGHDLAAFLSSSAFLFGLVATAQAGNYPYWLRSSLDPSLGLTASNSAAARYGLGIALAWWGLGIVLVAAYFANLFRSMRGKLETSPGDSY
ncbi:cytochrome d ubiquinol oxidase subunit II [Aquisphaera insulae]|uniref:cytochrome d ubiquinol oxidase subunit II n=1 Tax=Aquisphaera insulae TaxID=2712864 RepID=UPI0013E99F54|nr:cytochrome d ubiquinol oxidase subunit II [Aquisphaera insulae]